MYLYCFVFLCLEMDFYSDLKIEVVEIEIEKGDKIFIIKEINDKEEIVIYNFFFNKYFEVFLNEI